MKNTNTAKKILSVLLAVISLISVCFITSYGVKSGKSAAYNREITEEETTSAREPETEKKEMEKPSPDYEERTELILIKDNTAHTAKVPTATNPTTIPATTTPATTVTVSETEPETIIETTEAKEEEESPELFYLISPIGKSKKQQLAETYEAQKAELEEVLEEKSIPKSAKKLIRDILDKLYENYPEWRSVLPYMPSLPEYVDKYLISAVKAVNKVKMIPDDSEEGKKFEFHAYTNVGEEITMKYTAKSDDEAVYAHRHQLDLQAFYHEIIHCMQFDVLGWDSDNSEFTDGYDISDIMVEGGASFYSRFVNPISTEKFGSWGVLPSDESFTLEYSKEDCIGYLPQLEMFNKLEYLTDGKIFDYFFGYKPCKKTLSELISKKISPDEALTLIEDMRKWVTLHPQSCKNDELADCSLEIERIVLSYIEKQITELDVNNAKAVLKYADFYRGYKMHFLPVYMKNDKDKTYKVFDLERLDNLIIDKIIDSNAFGIISENENLNRMAVSIFITSHNGPFYKADGIYDDLYIPPCFTGVCYTYEEKGNKGELLIHFENGKYCDKEDLLFKFSEGKIKTIGGHYCVSSTY